MSINVGEKIPEFKLINTNKDFLEDKDFLGKKTMFVFIPFPFSSVCDKEICELSVKETKKSIENIVCFIIIT